MFVNTTAIELYPLISFKIKNNKCVIKKNPWTILDSFKRQPLIWENMGLGLHKCALYIAIIFYDDIV